MKAHNYLWLGLCLLLCSIYSLSAQSELTVGGVVYTLDATTKSATVSSHTADLPADLILPEQVTSNGVTYSVETIDAQAFSGATNLKSISIPGSVKTIQLSNIYSNRFPSPFKECRSLKSVRFADSPDKLIINHREIRENLIPLFSSSPLEEVYIGRDIKCVYLESPKPEDAPFYNQKNLAKVTFGPQVTEIDPYLFYGNNAITSVDLNQVQIVGASAFAGCSKLSILTFGEELREIGKSAFEGDLMITNLRIPNSTTTIGSRAFYGCRSITAINMGSSVRSVGASAFEGCYSFTAVRFGDNLEELGERAFYGCKKLTYVTLGSNLTSIGASTFEDCSALSEMTVPDKVTTIGDQAFANCSSITYMKLSSALKTIGKEVFYNNSGIVSLTIPGKVSSMGRNCFFGCTRLMYLTFADGVGTLEIDNNWTKSSHKFPTSSSSHSQAHDVAYNYFSDCPIRVLYVGKDLKYQYSSSKTYVDITGDSYSKRSMASSPFAYKKTLKKVTFGPNVTVIYDYFLYQCTGITEISIPENMRHVGGSAFCYTQIKSLTFPGLVTVIGGSAVDHCDSLKSVVFKDGVVGLFIRGGNSLFRTNPLNSVYIGRNLSYYTSPFQGLATLTQVSFSDSGTVTGIAEGLLEQCVNVPSLSLPQSLRFIGSRAFKGMTSLTTLSIPEAVGTIKSYAFADCDKLARVTLPSQLTSIEEGLFSEDVALLTINIPEGVKTIETKAFAGCKSLDKIVIPAATLTIENSAFDRCTGLKDLTLADGAEYLNLGRGVSNGRNTGLFRESPLERLHLGRWVIYDTSNPSFSPFAYITTLKDLTIGSTVRLIGLYAFKGCTSLPSVYIPDGVETIAQQAFESCKALQSVRLSERLISLGENAFAYCSALREVTIPNSLDAISSGAFVNCTNLQKASLGQINTIGPRAFKGCTKLTEISIPTSVYGLGVESFMGCTALTHIEIPENIKSVGSKAFSGCTTLSWVKLDAKVTSLGEGSFEECPNIGFIKSYNPIPPEGLPGFVQSVKEMGTLFVPEASIDMYKDSPTWEGFFNIKPLTEDILVSSVSLDKSEVSLKATERVTLTATVGAEDAVNKNILWKSSDATIAAVSASGEVTAVAVGTADIIAIAADGSGVKALCKVTVIPTLAESLQLDRTELTLKKTRVDNLTVSITPITTTNQTLVWSSSRPEIATIDATGRVKALSVGETTLTVTAQDGSQATAQCVLTVIDPTLGDSNDNDRVTVADAVNTANFIIGKEVEVFNFEAADINADNRITVTDASGTVAIVLEQPLQSTTTQSESTASISQGVHSTDYLIADNFTLNSQSQTSVGVALESSRSYVALQAVLTIGEGAKLIGAELNKSIAPNHRLVIKQKDEHTLLLVVYSLSNAPLISSTTEPLFWISVQGSNMSGTDDNITIRDILGSDTEAHEYTLGYRGGENEGLTSMITPSAKEVRLLPIKGGVRVLNAAGERCVLFAVDGSVLKSFEIATDSECMLLQPGLYTIAVGDVATKVVVE